MSNSSYSFNRKKFIKALQEWCGGRFNPLVGFPEKDGFLNVAYLYDDDYMELRENSELLMQVLQSKLHVPVVVFTEPVDKAKGTELHCDEWLSIK